MLCHFAWRATCGSGCKPFRFGTTPDHCKDRGLCPTGNDVDVCLGKRLRRRLLGLTQQQLAGPVGVRFQQIQKYECGANRISAARLWALSEALDVPVGYFYDGLTEAARRTAPADHGADGGEEGVLQEEACYAVVYRRSIFLSSIYRPLTSYPCWPC